MYNTHAVYDVNSTGISSQPHTDINYVAGLPNDPLLTPAANPPTPPSNATTNLQNIASFFRPRSILREKEAPIKLNNIFGDSMKTPIVPNRTRIYFINLNGINLTKGGIKFRDLCSEVQKADIHILAASEHNLDTNKFVVRQLLQQMAKQTFEHHLLQTATSSIPADKFYKPGGTLLLAQGDVVGRIKERGSDPLGRYSWLKLIGRNKRLITVISAYQVCVRPTHATGTTAYHQQESLLRQKGHQKPKPRKFFHRDLTEFIRVSKSRQELIILVGDFNEPMTEQSSMARIASKHQLVDILFQRNSHLPEPNTYARGSTRIDYALVSPELTDAVTECGYEPFHQRIKSDHRGFFLDFDTELLFGNSTPTLAPMSSRDFTSKNPANNSQYIIAKHAHLEEQDFFRHLAELQALPTGDHAKAERLDSMLRQASEHAGKQLKRFRRPWWSLKLTKQRVTTEILHSLLSGFRNNMDIREVLLARILEHSLDLILPTTKVECEELLRTSRQSLAAMEKNSLEIRHAEMEAKTNIDSASGDQSKK
jgi:hypothetical protein